MDGPFCLIQMVVVVVPSITSYHHCCCRSSGWCSPDNPGTVGHGHHGVGTGDWLLHQSLHHCRLPSRWRMDLMRCFGHLALVPLLLLLFLFVLLPPHYPIFPTSNSSNLRQWIELDTANADSPIASVPARPCRHPKLLAPPPLARPNPGRGEAEAIGQWSKFLSTCSSPEA